MSVPQFTMTESLILRNGIFAVEGLIVDLDNPGRTVIPLPFEI